MKVAEYKADDYEKGQTVQINLLILIMRIHTRLLFLCRRSCQQSLQKKDETLSQPPCCNYLPPSPMSPSRTLSDWRLAIMKQLSAIERLSLERTSSKDSLSVHCL
jgi:hypothetical protein